MVEKYARPGYHLALTVRASSILYPLSLSRFLKTIWDQQMATQQMVPVKPDRPRSRR
jgi:hypothetical protein